jgi:hypothetical protein
MHEINPSLRMKRDAAAADVIAVALMFRFSIDAGSANNSGRKKVLATDPVASTLGKESVRSADRHFVKSKTSWVSV